MLIWSLLILGDAQQYGRQYHRLARGLGRRRRGGGAPRCKMSWATCSRRCRSPSTSPLCSATTWSIDTYIGKVEHIGNQDHPLAQRGRRTDYLSNADILKSRVRNFGRLSQQRILATIRLTYDTPADKLKEMPKLLESIVREHAQGALRALSLENAGRKLFSVRAVVLRAAAHRQPHAGPAAGVNFRIIRRAAAPGRGVCLSNPARRLRQAIGPRSRNNDVSRRAVRARDFHRIPATPFACARTPARRFTWSSRWAFGSTIKVCSAPDSIITTWRK